MILIDPRAGSADLYPKLLERGVACELSKLDYGDVAFVGQGPTGSVSIGVEYKKVGDALTCMTGGRFAGHQLPGMMQTYALYWLLIEGGVRSGIARNAAEDGLLEVLEPRGWVSYTQGKRFVMMRDYQHWLMSMQIQGGCKLAYTSSLTESVAWLSALYSWWQKPWLEHKSVQAIYTGQFQPEQEGGIFSSAIRQNVSLRRLWAMQLPGIGTSKSKVVEDAFPTALELANADEAKWRTVDGIGKTLASKIVAAIRR